MNVPCIVFRCYPFTSKEWKDNHKQKDSSNANANGEKDSAKESANSNFNDSEKNNHDCRDETSRHDKSCSDVNSNFQATRATIASALGGQVKYNKHVKYLMV